MGRDVGSRVRGVESQGAQQAHLGGFIANDGPVGAVTDPNSLHVPENGVAAGFTDPIRSRAALTVFYNSYGCTVQP